MTKQAYTDNGLEIAVIGMSIRVPGADSLKSFWNNLINGVESTTFFSESDLEAAGVSSPVYTNRNYVPAKGLLKDGMGFESELFDFSHRESELMDPQLRIYYESVYSAMNNAGYQADSYNGLVGIYGGAGSNPYWRSQFLLNQNQSLAVSYEVSNLNGQEFFNTRVANTFNFKGPAVTVQTACSSSLVAIHLAVQGLIAGDCDIALAGGVEMSTQPFQTQPDVMGYTYQEGMIYSKDGHCRPFDAKAGGTVPADGAGIVVLKRLSDALDDGDHIFAVIKGSAVNNDGKDKAGFTAPSVDGQKRVISAALEMAEVEVETVGYVEAHGTGTKLGDPIEFRALNESYNIPGLSQCGLGSLKSNFGHLGAAAGVAGFIKTVLSIYHKTLVPSINYSEPNPEMDLADSPFYIVTKASPWPTPELPFRAGVSSFGIGGTNAHVILEEHIQAPRHKASNSVEELIIVSASNKQSLDRNLKALAEHLNSHSDIALSDIAYTLQRGREHLTERAALFSSDVNHLANALKDVNNSEIVFGRALSRKNVFMFPGQGAQYVAMGTTLYSKNETFKRYIDELFDSLPTEIADTIKAAWQDESKIVQTQYTQPLLFIVSYALARLLVHYGVTPWAMIGHSLGEYVAAAMAGVFTPENTLKLVCLRGKLMSETESGIMLAVNLPESELIQILPPSASIAAVNSKTACVVSGSSNVLAQFEKYCYDNNVPVKQLQTSHAFHSASMNGILDDFKMAVLQAQPNKPNKRFISNLTGSWITDEQAQNPQYWVDHLRNTVRFSDGIKFLGNEENLNYIEVGPSQVLSSLVKQHKTADRPINTIAMMGHDNTKEFNAYQKGLAKIYVNGQSFNWNLLGPAANCVIP